MLELNLKHLQIIYPGKVALDDVNMTIRGGELTIIEGEFGAGKSSLIGAIAGRIRHTGQISLTENGLTLTTSDLAHFCELNAFFRPCHLEDFIKMGLLSEAWQIPSDTAQQVTQILETFSLSHRANSYVQALTPDEMLLAAICYQLVSKPRLLLVDEPARSLSYDMHKTIMNGLDRYARDTGAIVIAATERATVSDIRHLLLKNGKVASTLH